MKFLSRRWKPQYGLCGAGRTGRHRLRRWVPPPISRDGRDFHRCALERDCISLFVPSAILPIPSSAVLPPRLRGNSGCALSHQGKEQRPLLPSSAKLAGEEPALSVSPQRPLPSPVFFKTVGQPSWLPFQLPQAKTLAPLTRDGGSAPHRFLLTFEG